MRERESLFNKLKEKNKKYFNDIGKLFFSFFFLIKNDLLKSIEGRNPSTRGIYKDKPH
jgi:hypothetical protein